MQKNFTEGLVTVKKTFALLMLASMLLASGCGNKAEETPAPPAEQKPAASTNAPTAPAAAEKFSIAGIAPGMSLDDAKKILGEPTAVHDNDEFTFANGLIVETDDFGKGIEEIKISQPNVPTGAGVAVGMTEQDLANAYGKPDSTENDNGKIEHKYYSSDRRIKIEFDAINGVITEIKLSVND